MACGVIACVTIAPPRGLDNIRVSRVKRTSPFGRERGRQRAVERRSRPCDDDEMREVENLAPAMPGRQPQERVGADDQRQRSRGGFVAQFRQRDDRVARARAIDLARVDFEARIVGKRESDHRQPVRSRGDGCAAMRRVAGGHQSHVAQDRVRRAPRARARDARNGSDRTCRPECQAAGGICAPSRAAGIAAGSVNGRPAGRPRPAFRRGRSRPRSRGASAR